MEYKIDIKTPEDGVKVIKELEALLEDIRKVNTFPSSFRKR